MRKGWDMSEAVKNGSLKGVRVLEFGAIGPAPFAAMVLADMGADVVRVTRPNEKRPKEDFTLRGKTFVELDLKSEGDVQRTLRLIEQSDILLEGNRPGVMERLGLGPDVALEHNPRLVYGRMTGWGQSGPLAQVAGHDINYLAVTGMLDAMRHDDGRPAIPLNLVGDLGGGAMFLIAGVLAAMHHANATGQGQVVDAAITDGVNLFSGFFHSLQAQGRWSGEPGENILDGGAPFYQAYRCSDGKFIALGSVEPQFYALLCDLMGLDEKIFATQYDRSVWPDQKAALAQVLAQKTRAEWCDILEGSDACFAPVLDMQEAIDYPHNKDRNGFTVLDGMHHPEPAPRFSRTPSKLQPIDKSLVQAEEVLNRWADW